MSQIHTLDRLASLLDQAKAIVTVSGTHESLDALSPIVLSNLFGLLDDRLSEMDKYVLELSQALSQGGEV
jgi:hypothetical protein